MTFSLRTYLITSLIISLLSGVIGWILHKPVCPEFTDSHFEKTDTVFIKNEISPEKIKLTGVDRVPISRSNLKSAGKFEPKTTVENNIWGDSSKINGAHYMYQLITKETVLEQINLCDSLHNLFYSTYHYELSDSDSIATIKAKVSLSENQPFNISFEKKYLVKLTADTIFVPKEIPTYKNGFVVSIFGGISSGASLGYQFRDKEINFGYDILNHGPVFGAKIHLGK